MTTTADPQGYGYTPPPMPVQPPGANEGRTLPLAADAPAGAGPYAPDVDPLAPVRRALVQENAIVIESSPRAIIPVRLHGVDYTIRPPKAALALKLAVRAKQAGDAPELMVAAVDEWIDRAFGSQVAGAIRARLDNEDDALDLPDLMTLMNRVIELTAGNPTG